MDIDLDEIYRLVREDMMGVAVKVMRQGLDGASYELQSRFENVEMLCREYYKYADRDMTANVKSAVLQIADDINDSFKLHYSLSYENKMRRDWYVGREKLLAALAADYDTSHGITMEMDTRLVVLFRQVWLSGTLDANTVQMLRSLVLSDGEGTLFARRMVVGALMLRCIRYYDIRIVQLLMDSPLAEAAVAVAMIMMACDRRIDCDDNSLALFRKYLDNDENLEHFRIVHNDVMRTFETQRIASEMLDKIIPAVRQQGMMFQEGGNNSPIFDENGLNPDWEEKLEESGIIDKMRRMNDLQMEGADIHFVTFKTAKSGAFFMETAHWFFPFEVRYHMLNRMTSGEDDLLGNFANRLNICDSDRYSIFIMLRGMGVGGLEKTLRNLGLGNYEDVREHLSDGDEEWRQTTRMSFETEARFAVMNLYRFYNLAPNHSDIISPFARIIPSERSIPGYSIVPSDIRYNAARMLFKAQQWDSACRYYQSTVDDCIGEDKLIYQKMGYCKEKMGKWSEAADDYNKSDILLPDDLWTIRHAAYCYRQLGDNDLAAGLYRKALDMASLPENGQSLNSNKILTNILESLADIYVEAGNYADAKPVLHRLEFYSNIHDNHNRLGYCLFMLGERAEASRAFERSCFGPDTMPADYFMRAIASGDEKHMNEAFLMNTDTSFSFLDSHRIKSMLSMLSPEEQYQIKSTLNKKILEQ